MAETEQPVVAAPEPEPKPLEAPKDPYDKPVLDSITKFFRNMSKKPGNFGFTQGGNLEIKEPAGTIQLKRFMPLEPSERAALEEYRLEQMADLQGQYEAERTKLNEAWAKYKSTSGGMREVIAANQRVAELDARMSAVRSAVRDIVPIDNPTTNEILLDLRYEERKLFGAGDTFGKLTERMVQFGQDVAKMKTRYDPFEKEVYRMIFHDFKPEYDQGKYVIDEEEAAAAASADAEAAGGEPSELTYKQTLKDGRKARIFFDPAADVNGFLSPSWPVRFTMGDTEYSSGIQAYEAERARELGMMDLRASLLKTNSPRTIRLMTRKVTAHPADAKGLWLKIFTEIYQQTEALKERLLATGTDALVYADIRAGPSGVGLDEKDSGVLDPAKWKGENAVGLAQETVRTQMREGNLEEAPANAAPKEAAITEEEQAKAKVAAIINARRNR